jgi:ABC-type uncharacterized transport system involved in gliding motility auxiliary subunit
MEVAMASGHEERKRAPTAGAAVPDLSGGDSGGIGRSMTRIAGYGGFFLILLNVIICLTRGRWGGAGALIPFAIGGVAVLVGIGTNIEAFADAVISRRTFVGFNVVLALAIAAFLVFVVNYAGYYHYKRADVTSTRKFDPDTRTKQILAKLDKEVKLWILMSRSSPDAPIDLTGHVKDLVEEMKSIQPKLIVEEIDPLFDERKARDLVATLKIQRPSAGIILECGDQVKVLKAEELFEADYGGMSPYGPPGEQPRYTFKVEDAIATAINGFINEKQRTIYFTTGHGEMPLEAAGAREGRSVSLVVGEMKRLGTESKTLDLSQVTNVPLDCDVLIVAGARRAFLPAEIEKIEDYLRGERGNLIYLADPLVFDPRAQRSGLEPILERYGVKMRMDVLCLQVINIMGMMRPVDPVAGEPTDAHPASAPLAGYRAEISDPCAIQITGPQDAESYQVFELLKAPSAYGETKFDRNNPIEMDKDDIRGPIVLGAAVGKRDKPGADLKTGVKIAAFASTEICSDKRSTAGVNFDMFINSVGWMLGREETMGIKHRKAEEREVEVPPNVGKWLFTGLVVFLPLGVLVTGGLVVLVLRR